MSLANWIFIVLATSGIILFLYGANFYVGAVGWVGLSIFILGVAALLALYVYGGPIKERRSEPVELAVFFLEIL